MNALQKWLVRLAVSAAIPLPQPKVTVVRTDAADLTLEAWRANEQMVADFNRFGNQLVYRAMLQTLRNESPLHFFDEAPGPDAKIRRLGIIEGYQLALNNLEALGVLAQESKMPEATFENTDTEPQSQPQE